MLAGIFALLLVPQFEKWVDNHVMSGLPRELGRRLRPR
jgi:hypothetical protein